METKFIGDFRRVHRIRQILARERRQIESRETERTGESIESRSRGTYLFVGKDQEHGVSQLVLLEHAVQLVAGLANSLAIVAVHDKDEALRVLEIVAPQRTDLVLAADVPHGEADVLVLDRLDVEADGGNGGDDLAQLELVQNGRLTGRVQADHQNSHLLFAKEAAEKICEQVAHDERGEISVCSLSSSVQQAEI